MKDRIISNEKITRTMSSADFDAFEVKPKDY